MKCSLPLSLIWILQLLLARPSMASSFAPQRVIISSTFVESGSSLFQLVPHSSAPTALLNLRAGSSPAPPNDEENHAALLRTEAVVADELSIASQTNSPVPEYDVELSSSARVVENGIPATRSLGRKAPPPGWLRRTLPDFPWHTVPNYLTYARCLAIPALIGIFYMPGKHVETAILFALASFTDYLDGYLARRWDISSSFGAFLDPVADKLMISTSLILLAGRYGAPVAVPAAIILARELAVSALREWMAGKGVRDIVQVGYQGKVKTALTMASLSLLLLVPATSGGPLSKLQGPSLLLLDLCAAITVTSGSIYFRAAAPILFASGQEE